MELQSLEGKVVAVTIPVNGKDYTMNLKVCRVKVRSVLFIEINREERKNIFRKAPTKMIAGFTEDSITFKEKTQLKKWESGWDNIGKVSPTVAANYGQRAFSNHSKGWSSSAPQYNNYSGVIIKQPKGAAHDALVAALVAKNSEPLPSTTNSAAGFPMV